MKKKREPLTAAESLRQLQSDPEWVRRMAEKEAKHKAEVAKLQAEMEPEQRPILNELASKGLYISSLQDLIEASWSYPEAIPVLEKYLKTVRHPAVREMIIRSLIVKESRGSAARTMLEELKRSPLQEEYDRPDLQPNHLPWVLANALSLVADQSMADEIETMLMDKRYEKIHSMLTMALKKAKRTKPKN